MYVRNASIHVDDLAIKLVWHSILAFALKKIHTTENSTE